MTVQSMLGNISQRELCHWIAFFKIENEEYDKKKKKAEDAGSKEPKVGQAEVSQIQKDQLMMQQLLAMSSKKE